MIIEEKKLIKYAEITDKFDIFHKLCGNNKERQ